MRIKLSILFILMAASAFAQSPIRYVFVNSTNHIQAPQTDYIILNNPSNEFWCTNITLNGIGYSSLASGTNFAAVSGTQAQHTIDISNLFTGQALVSNRVDDAVTNLVNGGSSGNTGALSRAGGIATITFPLGVSAENRATNWFAYPAHSNVQMNGKWLSEDGDSEGLRVNGGGESVFSGRVVISNTVAGPLVFHIRNMSSDPSAESKFCVGDELLQERFCLKWNNELNEAFLTALDTNKMHIGHGDTPFITVSTNGFVGINNRFPSAQFHMIGSQFIMVTNGGNPSMLFGDSLSDYGQIQWGSASDVWNIGTDADTDVLVITDQSVGIQTASTVNELNVFGEVAVGGAGYIFAAAPANGMIVEGNSGIGTNAPVHRFEVAGTAKVDRLIVGSHADGELWMGIDATWSATAAGGFEVVTNWNVGELWRTTAGSSPDSSYTGLTVNADGGFYDVDLSMSFSVANNNTDPDCRITIDGVASTNNMGYKRTITSSGIGTVAGGGHYRFAGGEVVSVRIDTSSSDTTYTFHNGNLKLTRIRD